MASTQGPPTSSTTLAGGPASAQTLPTIDIVVLVVYFLLVLAVGLWVGRESPALTFKCVNDLPVES